MRETLTRSAELDGEGGRPVLSGYAVRWNEWTRIDSKSEGTFMERFAPGAFDASIREDIARIRVLFMHGKDPVVGLRPLGSLEELRDDGTGLFYRVLMLDTSYVRELLPGLRSGLYGASVSFRTRIEDVNRHPGRSSSNRDGIPDVVIGAPFTLPRSTPTPAGKNPFAQTG